MRKIAITGGKGGVGKSTIAILLSKRLLNEGKKVILCDCDVECPNDFLLLSQKLKKAREKVFAEFPSLNKKKCQKCGICLKSCRENAIFQTPGDYPVFIRDLCSGCGVCWAVCPHKAINQRKEEIGRIFLNKINKDYWLITGKANPGLEETRGVVSKSKEFALNFAKRNKIDVVLFDTAAGTHCSVISAISDSDLIYAVTEPTPMGAYDLNLILELSQKLNLPVEIILNQANLGDRNEIQKIARKFKVKIREEVPYCKELVSLYAKGQLLKLNFDLLWKT